MLLRTWHVMVKEVLHLRRDRVLTLFLFLFPTLQLVLVAQTAGAAVGNLPLAVWDQDHSALSRRVIQALDNTPELTLAYRPTSMAEVRSLLDRGLAAAAVVIPPGFAADLLSPSRSPAVQVLVDGATVSAGSAALAAAEGAVEDQVRRYLAAHAALSGAGRPAVAAPAALHPLVRFNPELNGKFVAIPGLLAFVVYQVAIVVAAVTIVRERELGTLEQLAVSPVRGAEILTGKAIPAVAVAMLNFAVLLAVVTQVFHIPLRGSLPLLAALTLLFVTAEVGVGLMVSAIARTQQQAVLLVFPLAMVDLALSGYLVPVESMPAGLRALSLFSPLRHYMRILKDIMLKAADLSTLWPSALALAALALAVGLLALRNVVRNFE